MAIYEISQDRFERIPETDFLSEGIKERNDLQRLLRDQVDVLSPNTLVISEEFGEWEDSRRRIDLLGLDKQANLVVIELKRTEDGGHMELQAVRYAAMVSTLTFDKVVEIFGRFLDKMGRDDDPEALLLDFLEWDQPTEDEFAQDVKIILASKEFSKELTTAVIWLNTRGLDIRCIRMKPYKDQGKILVDIQTVIPLPEAEDYQVRIREKQQKERIARTSSRDLTKYVVTIDGEESIPLAKRRAILSMVSYLCANGTTPTEIHKVLSWRGNGLWLVVEGKVDSQTFRQRAAEAAESGGPAFEERRWFLNDDELIHAEGKTYALTKMWGVRTEEAMHELLDRFSGNDITFSPFNE
ncbi:hypothetical protein [Sedimenticola selenatireducens]|uniref:DUF91 domain-containing protein n=1 Tax=Sedimenticola selenatireducens TaxID=191960 RepID=A0A2N6CZQ5_9GAMM|nr:hypothetical protein [Sedimenticola selenatireducens]PLX62870.1 MAG: hypothetical protein C0630_04710 [Sedimenticola selenatireducens]